MSSKNFDNDGSHESSGRNGYYGNGHAPKFAYVPDTSGFEDEDESEAFSPARLLEILSKYKYLIVLFALTGGGLAYWYSTTLPRIFQSQGTLMIASAQSGQGYYYTSGDLSSLLSTSFGLGRGTDVSSEIFQFNSRQFAEHLADSVMQKRYMPNGEVFPLLLNISEESTSDASADQVVNRIRSGMIVRQSESDLPVLSVSFQSESPLEAREMVSVIQHTYMRVSTMQNRERLTDGIRFLRNERERVGQLLSEQELTYKEYMESESLVMPENRVQNVESTLTSLQTEIEMARINRAAIAENRNNLISEFEQYQPGLSEQLSQATAPQLNLLIARIGELQFERTIILSENPQLENNPQLEPELVRIDRQIANLQHEIERKSEELLARESHISFIDAPTGGLSNRIETVRTQLLDKEIEVKTLDARISFMEERLEEHKATFADLPQKILDHRKIQRQLQVAENLYMAVNTQIADLTIWEQTQMGFGRVVDDPRIPGFPISPNVHLITLIGFFGGLFIAFGLAFGREMTITEITSIDKLKDYNYPVLGVVPNMKDAIERLGKDKKTVSVKGRNVSTELITLLDSLSYVSDSYRRILNNIVFSQPDGKMSIIAVTSCGKSEGKTTLVSNLGIALAETGKKVLILDCDLRRPRVHRMFGFSKQPGLVDVLFDKAELKDALRETVVHNLDIMSAGPQPPSPGMVNNSRKMYELLEKLAGEYDHVLIDTPPYGIISDSAPLLRQASGVVVAVRFNQTKTEEISHILESLRSIKASIIGTSLIDFDPQKASGYYVSNALYRDKYGYYRDYHSEEAEPAQKI